MATYLSIFAAPDAHIDFIRNNPDSLWAYVDGVRPAISKQPEKRNLWQRMIGGIPTEATLPEIPANWPESEPKMIGPEINHRNVGLYHLLLNGTSEFVEGSGSLFQSWLSPNYHSAIDLTGHAENFAFKSAQIPELVELLSRVDAAAIKSRFTQWLRAQGDNYEAMDDECEMIAQEFAEFAHAVREAGQQSLGLIWTAN